MRKFTPVNRTQAIAQQPQRPAASVKYNYRVCICGVVRDIEPYINTTVQNLNRIASWFTKADIVLVESDSSDRTVQFLSRQPNIQFVTLGNLTQQGIHSREERIAKCRNTYLNHVTKNLLNYDLMIVVDTDDVLTETVNDNLFETCLSPSVYPTWDAVFANQSYRYYDIWALRDQIVNYDCWEKINSREMDKVTAILQHQHHIPKNTPMKPVISAFGGLGIYKTSCLNEECVYIGADNGKTMCEHVSLNTYLTSKGYKLFIDPAMVLETPLSFAKYYT